MQTAKYITAFKTNNFLCWAPTELNNRSIGLQYVEVIIEQQYHCRHGFKYGRKLCFTLLQFLLCLLALRDVLHLPQEILSLTTGIMDRRNGYIPPHYMSVLVDVAFFGGKTTTSTRP